MTPQNPPISSPKRPGILARAKQLGTGALLALAPLATPTEASPLTLDYSVAGNSSNSGFFTGVPDESKADGIILPGGFKLWGGATLTDDMFWRYDSYSGYTVPRGDFTGVTFSWGGKITGGATYEDRLSAPFDFTVAFTNALANSYTSVNVQLKLGYGYSPFTPNQYQSVAPYSGSYNSFYTSYSAAGSYHETGNLSVGLTESTEDLYWFAALSVDWNNEFNSSRYWQYPNYNTLNGDTLTVTIPQNSIDVTFVPARDPNPPAPRVPDSGSTFALLGLGFASLGWLRRRR